MGWLGDGSHRGQGRQAWTVVGLPPRYPLTIQGTTSDRGRQKKTTWLRDIIQWTNIDLDDWRQDKTKQTNYLWLLLNTSVTKVRKETTFMTPTDRYIFHYGGESSQQHKSTFLNGSHDMWRQLCRGMNIRWIDGNCKASSSTWLPLVDVLLAIGHCIPSKRHHFKVFVLIKFVHRNAQSTCNRPGTLHLKHHLDEKVNKGQYLTSLLTQLVMPSGKRP